MVVGSVQSQSDLKKPQEAIAYKNALRTGKVNRESINISIMRYAKKTVTILNRFMTAVFIDMRLF